MMETENAIISKTMLGFEDHGILTAFVSLKYDGGSQRFGGRVLKGKYCAEFITRILETVGVKTWEELPGKLVRVVHTNSSVYEIQHIIEDKKFNPESELNGDAAAEGEGA